MTVARVMRHKEKVGVVTVPPETSVTDAARLLGEKGIGTVVVSTDGERPVGILSERDIVRTLGKKGAACLDLTVGDLMTPDPQTCVAEDRADEVIARMTRGRFRHMPVMRDGRLEGMISLGDVVKARLDEAEAERLALEDMVAGR